MKTKLKSIIAYHMAVGHRVAAAMVCALCAVGLSAFAADPSVTVGEVTTGEPWSTITVNYTLGGTDAKTDYKVAFDVMAGGQIASVTNDATKLTDGAATKEINTVEIFGKEVVDTKAKVKVSLIAIKASSEPEYVVMKMGTGEGAYTLKWATMNLGAEKVTDCGDYFAWGETAPYYEGTGGWPTTPTWKSGKESGYAWQSYCGKSSFSEWSTPPYDATTKILKPEFDAAAQILGDGWRMPTSAEFKALYDACLNGSYDTTTNPSGASASVGKGVYWCTNYDGVAGCLFCDGTNKLFFPAAGVGVGTSLNDVGSSGSYWSSSLYSGYKGNADFLFFTNLNVWPQNDGYRYLGFSVRPVKEVK